MSKNKFLLLLLAILMCLSIFTGCSNDTKNVEKDDDEDDSYSIEERIVGFWQAKYIVEDGEDVDYLDLGIGFEAFDDGTMYNYNLFERFNEEPFEFTAIDDMQIYMEEGVGGNEYPVDFSFDKIDGEKYLIWEDATITMKFIKVDKDDFLAQAGTIISEPSSAEETQAPQELLGPLDGFADNKSYEIFSVSKAYKVFEALIIEGTFEDAIQSLIDAGMVEREAPYDNNVGGLKVEYSFEDEIDKYWITLNENSDGVYNSATYNISSYETANDITGFHAGQDIYDEMFTLIDSGEIINLSGVEEYFGKSYLQYKLAKADGSMIYYYAWRNKGAYIYCMVDDDMNFVSYKFGAMSLPDVYVDEGEAAQIESTDTADTDTQDSIDANSDATEFTPIEIDGMDIELDYLTITKIDGWSKMDIPDGVQLYKGSDVLQIGLEAMGLDDEYVKSYIENTINTYNGCEMATVDMWGYSFYATVYDYSGTTQMLLATLFNDDGQQLVVKIGYTGDDIPDDIVNMSNSVVIK